MSVTMLDAPVTSRPVYKERVLATVNEQSNEPTKLETRQVRLGQVSITKLSVIANYLSQSLRRDITAAEAFELALSKDLDREYTKALEGLAKLKNPPDPPRSKK